MNVGKVPINGGGWYIAIDDASTVHTERHGHSGSEWEGGGGDVVDGVARRDVGGIMGVVGARNGGGAPMWGGGASDGVRT